MNCNGKFVTVIGLFNKQRCRIYERAIEACGMEFRSDKLWEEYIAWELNNGETLHVGALYDRLLSTPTLLYSNHFDKLALLKFFLDAVYF